MPSHLPASPSEREIARGLKELKLKDWFSGHSSDALVISGPAAVLDSLGLATGLWTVCDLPDLASDALQNKMRSASVYILDPDDEPATVMRLRESLGHDRVYGIISELAVARTLGLDAAGVIADARRLPLPGVRYAVLSTARSGSTWFCHLLQSTGLLGMPREHLRPPVVFLARHAERFGFSPPDWADLLIRTAASGGVFGTKIIDDFVDDLLPALSGRDIATLAGLAGTFRFIHFERRDKVAQAVSKFMATRTHVWHLRERTDDAAYRQRAADIAYDGPALKAIHDGLVANEARYRVFLRGAGAPVLHLVYEDAVADPDAAVRRAARFLLGVVPDDLAVVHSSFHTMADDRNAAFAARLRSDYGLSA